MAIYKSVPKYQTINKQRVYVGSEKVKMTPTEVKRVIMKANNWTAEQYRKKYDIFKNKLRAYEAYEGVPMNKRQSPVEVLYKQAKTKLSLERQGIKYEGSVQMNRIMSFTSVSMSTSRSIAEDPYRHTKYLQRRTATYEAGIDSKFEALIKTNKQAEAIYWRIQDPVMRDKALADYANMLHAKMNAEGKIEANSAIAEYGEVVGSDLVVEFDISAYID